MPFLRFLLLPFRAPLLLVLFGVAVFLGHHWSIESAHLIAFRRVPSSLFWTVEVLQSLAIVLICTMPDVLLRQMSLLMASSRVLSLVATLLLVITVGLYVLSLSLLSDVLILASAILLARLDLTRIKVVPPPQVTAFWLAALVLSGVWLGKDLPNPLASAVALVIT
ncbi:MAG: hypothetical protein CMN98_08385 [Synechococcus sp. NP17]|jgi:hypothetical protein|nr:hypothetical protein [Synechococcus sp. NP17]|tara:strand:+ start:1719 stop:2216 length:498 start_codon:yes stop_codon:yes gene_type:complete